MEDRPLCTAREMKDWMDYPATREFFRHLKGWETLAMEELYEEANEKMMYRQQGRIRAFRETEILPENIVDILINHVEGDE